MGINQSQGEQIQDIKANNQQNNIQIYNEKQDYQEDRYLNFDNYIKQKSINDNFTALISNDEKYLAIFGNYTLKMQIYYLKNKKIMKIIQFEDANVNIRRIKFSNNSRYLLFGDNYGYLCCYDINNNYKIIHNQKVHQELINDILTLDSIKFFNRKDGKCLIKQQNAHGKIFGISMIQLSKDNYLISSSQNKLIVWQIDYHRLQLKKLKEFHTNLILNCTVIKNDKIVVIYTESIEILDKDLVVLQSIKHNIDIMRIYYIYDTRIYQNKTAKFLKLYYCSRIQEFTGFQKSEKVSEMIQQKQVQKQIKQKLIYIFEILYPAYYLNFYNIENQQNYMWHKYYLQQFVLFQKKLFTYGIMVISKSSLLIGIQFILCYYKINIIARYLGRKTLYKSGLLLIIYSIGNRLIQSIFFVFAWHLIIGFCCFKYQSILITVLNIDHLYNIRYYYQINNKNNFCVKKSDQFIGEKHLFYQKQINFCCQ